MKCEKKVLVMNNFLKQLSQINLKSNLIILVMKLCII